MKKDTVLILHNIRSTHNVGSVFRTADAAGVSKIFLTGYTPTPLDRFGRARKDIAKTALGAEKSVPWEQVKNPQTKIRKLKKEGWMVVGVEQDLHAKSYKKPLPQKCAFIFGNEVRGLSKSIRNACDMLVEIPMRGAMVRQAHHPRHKGHGKESLNVSVAAGIILFSHQ